jgi:hypothetical protein
VVNNGAARDDDGVLARRAKVVRFVTSAKRVGYGALLVAIVAFVIGAIGSFPAWTVTVATAGLVVSCIALPPAVVLGYGVRAAVREERERQQGDFRP